MEEQKKHDKKCIRCKEYFEYTDLDAKWDYGGYTPTKLACCDKCGCWQAVKFEAEKNVNFDPRYYE